MNTYIERETVIVSGAEQWEMYSDIGKRKYRIYISKPKQPAPDSGYPVIYVLDGNAYFQTFQEAMKVQSGRAEKTGVPASIIVGIGYPIEGVFAGAERCYDFTPYPLSVDAPPKPDGKPWPKSGGANKFLAFIQEELKPQIEKNFTINPKNRQYLDIHLVDYLHCIYCLQKSVRSKIISSAAPPFGGTINWFLKIN